MTSRTRILGTSLALALLGGGSFAADAPDFVGLDLSQPWGTLAAASPSAQPAPTVTAIPPQTTVVTTDVIKQATAPMITVPSAADISTSDNSFVEALSTVYQNNPRILAERKRQESTDEQIAEAVSGFRPTIDANYNVGRQRTAFNGSNWSINNESDKELRFEEPIFRGGGTYASWQSAKRRVQAGASALSALEQQVMLATITAYMDVAANTAVLEDARNNLKLLQEQVASTRERFKYGEVTKADVAQAEASMADARAQVASAQGALVTTMAQFQQYTGFKPKTHFFAPSVLPEMPGSLDDALAEAHAANPQLLEAIYQAKAADYDVRTNESALAPQLSLVGTMSRQTGIGLLGSDRFNQDQIGLQVSIPLYQSGSEYAKIREAKATARQRKYQTQDTKLSVDESVAQAWQQFATASLTATARAEQIKAAQVQLDGMRAEQNAGARTVFDVLEAEQTLFNAQISHVQAQHDRVIATYNLLFNLGKLTPETLGLPVHSYDPTEHLRRVAWLPAGF